MHDARPVVAVERSPPPVAPVKLAALAPAPPTHGTFKRPRCESGIPVIPWVGEHNSSLWVAARNPPESGASGRLRLWQESACKISPSLGNSGWHPRISGPRTVCLSPRSVGGFVHLVLGFSPFAEG